MGRIRRIIVLGAGVAGLACALAAARAGVAVDVLDVRPALSQGPGHVDVVPNMLRDLERLGVAQACVGAGFSYSRIVVADARGRSLYTLPLQRLAGQTLPTALGMQHADLLQVLATAAFENHATLSFGTEAIAIDEGGPRVGVLFDSGGTRDADLIVVATGAASSLRRYLFASAPDTALLGQRWIHAMVPRTPGLDQPTWLVGSAQRVLCVPVSATRAGLALVQPSVDGCSEVDALQLREALREFSALPSSVTSSLDRGDEAVAVREIREGVLERWHSGRVLCVGEAAHAIAPHFGQRAAQSVEDAVVLGELLTRGLDLDELLQRFSERRVSRAQRVAALAGQAARWDMRPQPDTDVERLAGLMRELTAEPA